MNNYWTTNFNAEQRGGINWVYTISSSKDQSQTAATRFGWGNRMPFLARVIPGGGVGGITWGKSILKGWPENVLLVSSTPDIVGNSCIMHIRETGGEKADLKSLKLTNGKPLNMRQVNALGEEFNTNDIELSPYEAKFIRVAW